MKLLTVTALSLAVLFSSGFARSDLTAVHREKQALGCLGSCVPESDYLSMKRLAAKRLRGWNRANRSPREVVDAERAAQHGTESKYRNGCRCDLCKSAANADRARRRLTPNPARHGVYSSYGNGCRCDACREAHARYRRELKARRMVTA